MPVNISINVFTTLKSTVTTYYVLALHRSKGPFPALTYYNYTQQHIFLSIAVFLRILGNYIEHRLALIRTLCAISSLAGNPIVALLPYIGSVVYVPCYLT